MACCQAKVQRGGIPSPCGGQIFKCDRCGATGCSNKGCPNQKFDGGRCTVCGGNLRRAVN